MSVTLSQIIGHPDLRNVLDVVWRQPPLAGLMSVIAIVGVSVA